MRTGPAAVDRPRWRRWLLVAPWLVALGIGLVASLPTGSTAGPAAAPPPTANAPSADVPRAVQLDPGTTARVLAAARTALGSHGLSTSSPGHPGARDRWVLDQVASDPIPSGEGAVLVVVHATVITRGDTGWTGPTVAAAAVPVVLGPPVELGSVEVIGPPPTAPGTGPHGATPDGADARGDAGVTAPAPDHSTTSDPTTPAGPLTTSEDQ